MHRIRQKLKSNIIFSRADFIKTIFAVIPGFALIASGNLTGGIAFTIGLLPASQLGIAPKRKQRIAFALFGCFFGVGVYSGALIAQINNIYLVAATLFFLSYLFAVTAAKKEIGIIFLALILPSIAVGLGYDLSEALGLALAFILGSIWSGIISLFWPETKAETDSSNIAVFMPKSPKIYGVLLGLTAATSVIVGYYLNPAYAGWTATAALLIMRPYSGMVKNRSINRAASTVLGTVLAVFTVQLDLPYSITAILISTAMIFAISTRKSSWYIVPFTTSFLILTLILYESTAIEQIQEIGWRRIADNVVGAFIAIFYGLVVPYLLSKKQKSKTR